MSKKKQPQWGNLLWGVLTETAVYAAFILLTAMLAVRGILPAERCVLLLTVGALLAVLTGGMLWGRRTPVRGWGCVLCTALLGLILFLGNLSFENGVSATGLPILFGALLGGIGSLVLTGKRKSSMRKRKKVNL